MGDAQHGISVLIVFGLAVLLLMLLFCDRD